MISKVTIDQLCGGERTERHPLVIDSMCAQCDFVMPDQFGFCIERDDTFETERKAEVGRMSHQIAGDADITLVASNILRVTFEQVSEDEAGFSLQRNQALDSAADCGNRQLVNLVDRRFGSPIKQPTGCQTKVIGTRHTRNARVVPLSRPRVFDGVRQFVDHDLEHASSIFHQR